MNRDIPAERDGNAKWFEEWFDRDEYKIVYQHRDEAEAAEVVRLIRDLSSPLAESSILDVGCGRGRHAILLAEAGYKVTGIDLSARSIDEAREAADDAGVSVDFAVADMREVYCRSCFDGVVNLFTAFGYFRDASDHQKAMDAMAASIRSGGWLVQDFLNADYVRDNLVPHDSRVTSDSQIEQHRWIEDGRINKRIEFRDNRTRQESVFDESVALLDLSSLERLHRKAGLRVAKVVGDYSGGPLTPISPRLILLSRKD